MSQGAVSEYLQSLISRQVDDHGLVVWYDPEQAYGAAAAQLHLQNTTVARYDGSFIKLRKEIDHLLNNGQPPRLVVYVPVERTETAGALIELDCAGVIMQPRQQPPACNTRLSVVARNALKPILGEEQVVEIERQAESGILSLADLNSLASKGKDISTGVLTLIFGSANPQEVALTFVHGNQHDEEIGKKSAERELRQLLQVNFDIELPDAATLTDWRERLARHVLLTDLVKALGEHTPSALASAKVATSPGAVDSSVRLARSWRNNRDHRDSYVDAASSVSHLSFVPGPSFFESKETDLQASLNTQHPSDRRQRTTDHGPRTTGYPDTFLAVEQASSSRRKHAAGRRRRRLASDRRRPAVVLLGRGRSRRSRPMGFVAAAAEVLLAADRVAKEIKNPRHGPRAGQGLCGRRRSVVPAGHVPSAHGEPLVQFRACNRREHEGWTSSSSRPSNATPRSAPNWPSISSTSSRRPSTPSRACCGRVEVFESLVKPKLGDGKDRLRLGGCSAVRDGQGTVRSCSRPIAR